MRASNFWILLLTSTLAPHARSASVNEFLATENVGFTPLRSFTTSSNSTKTFPSLSIDRTVPASASGTVDGNRTSGNCSQCTNAAFSNGIEAASRCNNERISYSLASESWDALVSPTVDCSITTYSYGFQSIDTTLPIPWTTFCDGHPRTPSGFTYPTLSSWVTESASACGKPYRQNPGTFTSPSPSCTIAPSDCNKLYEDVLFGATAGSTTPLCSTVESAKLPCGECTIFANELQLLYWPVTRPAGDLCGNDGSAITAATTLVTNLVEENWRSTANISMFNIFATAANGALCGTVVDNFNVALPVRDLSTISHSLIYANVTSFAMYTQPMNLADLNYPVPWSAYRGMETCMQVPSACDTVTLDYQPRVVLPTWLTGIQEQWRSCTISTGVYDPPKALTVESMADSPTLPTTSSSIPGSSIPMPGASVSVASPTITAMTEAPATPYSPLAYSISSTPFDQTPASMSVDTLTSGQGNSESSDSLRVLSVIPLLASVIGQTTAPNTIDASDGVSQQSEVASIQYVPPTSQPEDPGSSASFGASNVEPLSASVTEKTATIGTDASANVIPALEVVSLEANPPTSRLEDPGSSATLGVSSLEPLFASARKTTAPATYEPSANINFPPEVINLQPNPTSSAGLPAPTSPIAVSSQATPVPTGTLPSQHPSSTMLDSVVGAILSAMQQMPAAQSISPASQVSSVTDTLRNTSPDTEVVRGTPYPGNAETTLELQSMSYQDPTSLPVIVVANQTGGSIGVQAIHTSSTPSDLLLLMSSATTILPVIVVAKQPGRRVRGL
ncbi:hypothetical protein LTR73_008450 [Friedmanniomyces endolithicus]|nr:hypothetical protein LTR73_008450 [Friedmanniomyces endolithicus]